MAAGGAAVFGKGIEDSGCIQWHLSFMCLGMQSSLWGCKATAVNTDTLLRTTNFRSGLVDRLLYCFRQRFPNRSFQKPLPNVRGRVDTFRGS